MHDARQFAASEADEMNPRGRRKFFSSLFARLRLTHHTENDPFILYWIFNEACCSLLRQLNSTLSKDTMKRLFIDAYKVFEDLYNNYTQKKDHGDLKNLIVLFTGNDDPKTGQSWCPHCVLAKPVIEKAIENCGNSEQIAFATVRVGHRDEWKKPDNPYRLHELKINCVPTLISLSNNIRLNGSECWDQSKVSHLFSKSL